MTEHRKSPAERMLDYATRKLGHRPTQDEFDAMAAAGEFDNLLTTPQEDAQDADEYRRAQMQKVLSTTTHGDRWSAVHKWKSRAMTCPSWPHSIELATTCRDRASNARLRGFRCQSSDDPADEVLSFGMRIDTADRSM
jgi:hypothetical protein